MADLLRLLLQVAEKAANVARVCRQEAPLFQLLVQEKTGDDKNKKFVQDFKTLADVVIQEMIRHDVGAQVRGRDGGEVTPDWWRSLIFALLVFSSRRWSASSTERSPTSLKMGLVIVAFYSPLQFCLKIVRVVKQEANYLSQGMRQDWFVN